MTWEALDQGATIGQKGSENGIILQDEQSTLGARITLEKNTQNAPFAITCGIYGWMVHTRFFSWLPEAVDQYEKMKERLSAIIAIIPPANHLGTQAEADFVSEAITEFIDQFP